jgi:hypothetical protein
VTRSRFDVRGSLLERNFVAVRIKFPGASPSVAAADWEHPQKHSTSSIRADRALVQLERKLDDDRYVVTLQWSDGTLQRRSEHEWELTPRAGSQRFWFTCEFTPTVKVGDALDANATFAAAAEHWNKFWTTGGAVDLSASRDPRWKELERRIVPLAVSHRDPVQRLAPARRDGADLQQLVRQVSSGDALVARRPFPAVGAGGAARTQPRLLRPDPRVGARAREAAGLRRRTLAENERPQRRRLAEPHRAAAHLATAAPDLLR